MTTTRKMIVFLAVLVMTACAGSPADDRVCFDGTCFQVEVATTEAQRTQGLMHRAALPADTGMLFIFGAERPYSFWMKNCLISLDIIWMDYSRRIVHIEQDVPPCQEEPCPSYRPAGSALYVLEVNAGTTAQLGIAVGDLAEFRLKSLSTP